MNQTTIASLIAEASKPTCTVSSRERILQTLQREVWPGHQREQDQVRNGVTLVIDSVYCSTIEHRPSHLTKLLPFFESLSGVDRLMDLLEEASSIGDRFKSNKSQSCDGTRICQIQCDLTDHLMCLEGVSMVGGRDKGFQLVLDRLFTGIGQTNPVLLMDLLPVFAVICGDRDGMVIAQIDWSLIR